MTQMRRRHLFVLIGLAWVLWFHDIPQWSGDNDEERPTWQTTKQFFGTFAACRDRMPAGVIDGAGDIKLLYREGELVSAWRCIRHAGPKV